MSEKKPALEYNFCSQKGVCTHFQVYVRLFLCKCLRCKGLFGIINIGMKNKIYVVAALIWKNGKFLACKRPANKARAHLWEFVGGKVEKGETPQQALKRECMEELALKVEVSDVFLHVLHEYDDVTVDLTLFNATTSGIPQMLEMKICSGFPLRKRITIGFALPTR